MTTDQRLIEDDIPIEAISAEARREKSVHKGVPLHAAIVVGAPPSRATVYVRPSSRQIEGQCHHL